VIRRLLLSYLTITAIVLLVLEVPLGLVFQQRVMDNLKVNVERDATVLASRYEDALERQLALDPHAAATYATRTGVRVVVVDKRGMSLVDTGGPIHRDFSTRPEITTALRGDRSTGTRRSNTLKTNLMYVAVPIASGGTVLGAMRLTLDTQQKDAVILHFWLGLLGVAAVVLAAVAVIGWTIARSLTRPLRNLHAVAARFSTGDLTPTSPQPGAPPEVAALTETMNAMAQRLERLLDEHRSFVADASHQLRTPLTALRLRLENLQSDWASSGGEPDLAAAIDETNRLAGLVNDLLMMARAEQTAAPESVDLVQLVSDRVDTWSASAEAAGVALDFVRPDGPIRASAVPAGIEQILDNVIDNAIAASPTGSRVTVTIDRGHLHHRLTVADEGPGLTDELKTRALDRFWRLDESKPGTGLGLPIARALAEASGGSLELHDVDKGGLAVVVSLRAAKARGAVPR
jgi:signal transduction histidine kinase